MRYGLGKEDLIKIGNGALVAVGGALLTYITVIVGKVDFGIYTPLAVAVAGVIVNVGRKILDGVKI